MNKDVIVLLLQKDISELGLLTAGFEKMNNFPEPLLQLATEKAENVVDALNKLSDFSHKMPEEMENAQPTFVPNVEATQEQSAPEEVPVSSSIERGQDAEITDFTSIETVETMPETTTEVEEDTAVSFSPEAAEENMPEEPMNEAIEEVEKPPVPVHAPAETPSTSVLNDTLLQQDNSLSSNLANQKVDDIRAAINIGDRFRFQRELFGGNGEMLNKTINYLNQLANFSEAEAFLKSKFAWKEDDNHAIDFLQIVKRRYLQ